MSCSEPRRPARRPLRAGERTVRRQRRSAWRQLAPQKGVSANDLNAETERLYEDHVAPQRLPRAWGRRAR